MLDWQSHATKNGLELKDTGPCQFCGAPVSGGVLERHNNTNRITEILDYNDASNYTARFLSVDAMALQHYELHGPWNNYIHFSRLVLIFEKEVQWNYMLTPLLSNVVNEYKRNRNTFLFPPRSGDRGRITTTDLLEATTAEECREVVSKWAYNVYEAFYSYRLEVEEIVSRFLAHR